MYGITETTVHVTYRPITKADLEVSRSPIGERIVDLGLRVLDSHLSPTPIGVAGELYVSGGGLSRGYLHRGGLTAERFIADPFGETGDRLYRTGDRVRWNGTGQLDYEGRVDSQVKIRGFRIELGEIEAQLRLQPHVREAVVAAKQSPTGTRLVAYVVCAADTYIDAAAIRQNLGQVLPDYMVPSAIVVLEKLPLTANGKLDREALPEPEYVGTDHYQAPQGELEETLAGIWSEVLGVDRVGRGDNFFELGGDSILSLQIVARARSVGWKLTPRQIFERQTLVQLASVAEAIDITATTGEEIPGGTQLLLPIQAWFFEQEIPVRHHWNQSVLLRSREPLDIDALSRAFRAVTLHHDVLRLRYRQDKAGTWNQFYAEPTIDQEALWIHVANDANDLTTQCDAAQRSLNLNEGPMFRAAVFTLSDGSSRLLLVIHHLVVDGVSWRILLQDLQQAYMQARASEPIRLSPKTSSYRKWSQRLQQYPVEHAAELVYWRGMIEGPVELPCDDPDGGNTVQDQTSITLTVDRGWTQRLLKDVSAAYRTQINDVLLTALGRALCEWTGHDRTLIDLEGHGREDLFEDIDLSRTVGWFTSLYPIVLEPMGELGLALMRVKERLRQVPSKGLGYGAFHYLGTTEQRESLAPMPRRQVVFNYLGQFDGTFDDKALWQPAAESAGSSTDPQSPRKYELSISGRIYDGELQFGVSYSRQRHGQSAMHGLVDRFRAELEALITHCTSGIRRITPSDFPLAKLSQEVLDALPTPAEQVEDLYPMTALQQGLLFHTLHDPTSGAYVNQLRVDVEGLDVPRFKAAWQEVVDRHEVLRTGFLSLGELSLQCVVKHAPLTFLEQDWRHREDLTEALSALSMSQRSKPFDLAAPPLMRFALVRTREAHHHFLWTNHHVLTDGWSTAQVIGEVLHHYHHQTLPGLQGRYRDYVAWLQRRDTQGSERYWRAQLQRLEEPTRLVSALPNSQRSAGYAERIEYFDEESTAVLVEFAKRERVTMNTLVQGAWALLLSRYTNQRCVTFGVTTSGRPAELPGVEQLIGLFINTFPLITTLRPEKPVGDWLRDLQSLNVASREHEHTPLYQIQSWAEERGHSLFDVLLAFQNYPVDEALRVGPAETVRFSSISLQDPTHYPMTVQVIHNNTLCLRYHYRCEYFTERGCADVALHIHQLLSELAVNGRRCLGDISVVNQAEARHLRRWSVSSEEHRTLEPVHRLIEGHVGLDPVAHALIDADVRLSYEELNVEANRLAHRLLALGVKPEVRVGLTLERSKDLVVGVLAILKAGGAYVPLDPAYPADRLSYMMQDSGIELLLTQSSVAGRVPAVQGIASLLIDALDLSGEPAHDPGVPVHPDNLAYVIYTSGSTGRPKGAQLSHRNVARLLKATQEWFHFDNRDVWTLFHSYAFDFSVWEIFGALCYGGTLVIVPYEVSRSPEDFLELLRRERVTVLNQTPSAFKQLLQVPSLYTADDLALRAVIFGGEALDPRSLRPWLEHFGDEQPRLINMYGITETTVHVTYRPITKADLATPGSPIGGRIPDLGMLVLDADLNTLPMGLAGELYVAGDGLARGYLNRAGLTAERFVANPMSGGGERIYRTGDRVRCSPDGQLEYLGRIDQQVKIRGFRIELGEIEKQLRDQDEVIEAVVIAKEHEGDERLLAYVVPDAKLLSTRDTGGNPPARKTLVTQWESVFDSAYAGEDFTPSFRGWNSSYTDQPIADDEMQEWLQSTVSRIRALKPQRILEIGCGVGLLVQQLAPQASLYAGTDLSGRAVSDLGAWIATKPELSHVQLRQAEATDFTGFQSGEFDTVVLNSVAQYLPDIDYLLEVLKGAVRVISPQGRVFVGDLRHLAHVPMFHSSVQLSKASSQTTLRQLKSRIERAVADDKELVLDPAVFQALAAHLGMGSVEIQLKRGRFANELTNYRYDVVMQRHVMEEPVGQTLNGSDADALEKLCAYIRKHRPAAAALRAVPNRRLARDLAAWRLLQSSDERLTVGEVLRQLEGAEFTGIDPEELWMLGDAHGYQVQISWAPMDGAFDARFIELSSRTARRSSTQSSVALPEHWRTLASHPARALLRQDLGHLLRQRLVDAVPDYMVPSAIVVLEKLPLNANGKLDRKALPEPTYVGAGKYDAPQGEIEKALAAIWSHALNVERVGRDDNFFELGGDSILSLQIVARARREGWKLTPRQIFERQTLAQLAAVVEALKMGADKGEEPSSGLVPLLPIQEWFFEQSVPARHHWNQSVLLRTRQPLEGFRLHQALRCVVEHHDALRLRYRQVQSDQWEQRYASAAEAAGQELLWLREAGTEEEIAQICLQAQRSLNLSEGPLLRAVSMAVGDGSQRLLLVAHHLVVDGVSWRILLEDLQSAYQQAGAARHIVIPAKTSSYQRWAQRLRRYASEQVGELSYWQALKEVPARMPCDDPQGSSCICEQASETLHLDREKTEALLKEVPSAYRTQINDVLLTALGRALCRWSGQEQILIDLEGHGREDPFEDVDLSRTVGWFTIVYPVALAPLGDIGTALKRVKERLRGIPNKGLGFGALRYMGSAKQREALSVVPPRPSGFQLPGTLRRELR